MRRLIDFLPRRTAKTRRADRGRPERIENALDTLIPTTRTSPTTCAN
jgi:hypothetical protein